VSSPGLSVPGQTEGLGSSDAPQVQTPSTQATPPHLGVAPEQPPEGGGVVCQLHTQAPSTHATPAHFGAPPAQPPGGVGAGVVGGGGGDGLTQPAGALSMGPDAMTSSALHVGLSQPRKFFSQHSPLVLYTNPPQPEAAWHLSQHSSAELAESFRKSLNGQFMPLMLGQDRPLALTRLIGPPAKTSPAPVTGFWQAFFSQH